MLSKRSQNAIYLINMNHSVNKGPEKRVSAESTEESVREQRFS